MILRAVTPCGLVHRTIAGPSNKKEGGGVMTKLILFLERSTKYSEEKLGV